MFGRSGAEAADAATAPRVKEPHREASTMVERGCALLLRLLQTLHARTHSDCLKRSGPVRRTLESVGPRLQLAAAANALQAIEKAYLHEGEERLPAEV